MQHLQAPRNVECKRYFAKRWKLCSEVTPNNQSTSQPISATPSPDSTNHHDSPCSVNPLEHLCLEGGYSPNRAEQNDSVHDNCPDDEAVFVDDTSFGDKNVHIAENSVKENAGMMGKFKEYVQYSQKNRSRLDSDMQAGIELMNLLHSHGLVSLYDSLMNWHIAHLDCKQRLTKKKLTEKLRKRYNLEGCRPYINTVSLPSSGLNAKIPCHDAQEMMMDLLTDPRIIQEDYLWFDNDPLGQPPSEWTELGDINDGLAYRKTYEELILPQPCTSSGRRRVLLPVICYMDGCVTGLNQNLSIEIMKFTLGIFTSEARDKDYTWRSLGAVPQNLRVREQAKDLIAKSGHSDAIVYLEVPEAVDEEPVERIHTREFDVEPYINSSDDEDSICDVPLPDTHAQDFHVILKVIMSGMQDIFRTVVEALIGTTYTRVRL